MQCRHYPLFSLRDHGGQERAGSVFKNPSGGSTNYLILGLNTYITFWLKIFDKTGDKWPIFTLTSEIKLQTISQCVGTQNQLLKKVHFISTIPLLF